MSSASPTYLMRDAIRGHQTHSDALGRTQSPDEGRTQRQSDAYGGIFQRRPSNRASPSKLPSCPKRMVLSAVPTPPSSALSSLCSSAAFSVAVSGHQRSSEVIRGHLLHSPVQQRRILRGRALIHVLNRTQVVLPPNPSVQLSRGNHIRGNQWQSVAISGS